MNQRNPQSAKRRLWRRVGAGATAVTAVMLASASVAWACTWFVAQTVVVPTDLACIASQHPLTSGCTVSVSAVGYASGLGGGSGVSVSARQKAASLAVLEAEVLQYTDVNHVTGGGSPGDWPNLCSSGTAISGNVTTFPGLIGPVPATLNNNFDAATGLAEICFAEALGDIAGHYTIPAIIER